MASARVGLRHTFAAWSLTIDMDKNRLVYLMGHGSKQMVYETYGKYVKNMEKDRDKILAFLGYDFVNATKRMVIR